MKPSLQTKEHAPGQRHLALNSPAFVDGEDLPRIYTAEGSDLSPPLHWQGIPEGTASFVLFFENLDITDQDWVHWLLFDIPANVHGLPAGVPCSPSLANGARHGLCWGYQEYSRLGYQGPARSLPPCLRKPDQHLSRHHLRFTLFALDQKLALPVGTPAPLVREEMNGHQLSTAQLNCCYNKSSRKHRVNRSGSDQLQIG
jgi:Raf kinase inhibitor-like YbhB/YbcL family protein